MIDKLLIDTWGWITLSNKREPGHGEATILYERFRSRKGAVYTTDYILDETITLLFRRASFNHALEALRRIDESIQEGYLRVEWINADRFIKAKRLRLCFKDKPLISFTDLTSIVVMDEVGIHKILTEDAHFIQVGMGFQRLP